MTIEAKLRVDYVGPDQASAGNFLINGSLDLPEDHPLTLGHTYHVTLGDEVNDEPIPTPEPGTEADPPPLAPETAANPT